MTAQSPTDEIAMLLDHVSGPPDILERIRTLLKVLAEHGESGPATEPGSEPEVGTNA